MSWSEQSLTEKLNKVNGTAESIQSTASWMIRHVKYAARIVAIWSKITVGSQPKHQLVLFYLANDVIQKSKRNAPAYLPAFQSVLPATLQSVVSGTSGELPQKVARVLAIWEQRNVYPSAFLRTLRSSLQLPNISAEQKFIPAATQKGVGADDGMLVAPGGGGMGGGNVSSSIASHPVVKMMMEMEGAASMDGLISRKVSTIPPHVYDAAEARSIGSIQALSQASDAIEQTHALLTQYMSRLTADMARRGKLIEALEGMMTEQRSLIAQSGNLVGMAQDTFLKLGQASEALIAKSQVLPNAGIAVIGLKKLSFELPGSGKPSGGRPSVGGAGGVGGGSVAPGDLPTIQDTNTTDMMSTGSTGGGVNTISSNDGSNAGDANGMVGPPRPRRDPRLARQ